MSLPLDKASGTAQIRASAIDCDEDRSVQSSSPGKIAAPKRASPLLNTAECLRAASTPPKGVRFRPKRVSPADDGGGPSPDLTPRSTPEIVDGACGELRRFAPENVIGSPIISRVSLGHNDKVDVKLQRLVPRRASPPPKFMSPEVMPTSASSKTSKAYLPVKQLRGNLQRTNALNDTALLVTEKSKSGPVSCLYTETVYRVTNRRKTKRGGEKFRKST